MLKFRLENTKNGLLGSAMFYATNQQKIFLNVNLKNISYLEPGLSDMSSSMLLWDNIHLFHVKTL